MKRLSLLLALVLSVALLLAACGDSTPTVPAATTAPATTAVATTAPATTVASTTAAATTAAPATTAAATTVASTTAAATGSKVSYPLTVTDGSGVSVTVPKKPERIVCLTEACLDVLVELELPMPVAVTDLFYGAAINSRIYGEAAKNIGRIPYKNNSIDLELLAQFKPDLIIDSEGQGTPRDAVKKIAPLYVTGNVKNVQTAIDVLKQVAQVLDRVPQAEVAAKRLTDKVAAYKAKSPRDVTVLIMANYSDGSQYVSTKDQAMCATLNEVVKCGIEAPAVFVGYALVSIEALLQFDPQVILANTVLGSPKGAYAADLVAQQEQARKTLLANPLWQNVSAVKNSRVYDVDRTVWYPTSGTRSLGIILDDTMTKLYPNIFPKTLP